MLSRNFFVLVLGLLILTFGPAKALEAQHCNVLAGAGPPDNTERDLFIVSHPDDDLLFMSPELLNCVQEGHQIMTIFLTSGDDGMWWPFWQYREAGVLAAYAEMAGVANSWTASNLQAGDKVVQMETLNASPGISVVFLRLPDGNVNGHGFDPTGHESLRHLWSYSYARMTAVDGTNTYSSGDLIQTLVAIMTGFQPQYVYTLDASNLYGDDHSDHQYGARFAFEAHQAYALVQPHTLFTYRGYNISSLPANLSQQDYDAKREAFLTYAGACATPQQDCLVEFGSWGYREYDIAAVQNLQGQMEVASGGCLAAAAGDDQVVVVRCADPGSENYVGQTWSVNDNATITAFDGRCMDIPDGPVVRVDACNGSLGQRWTAFENGQIRGLWENCLFGHMTGLAVIRGCEGTAHERWILPPANQSSP